MLIFYDSAFLFKSFLVINETHSTSSVTTPDKSQGVIRKRRPTRVRSLIKSSIEKLSNQKQRETIGQTVSTNIPIDKRPFPFGDW